MITSAGRHERTRGRHERARRKTGWRAGHGDETGLRDYSAVCLQHTWTYQEFSRWDDRDAEFGELIAGLA